MTQQTNTNNVGGNNNCNPNVGRDRGNFSNHRGLSACRYCKNNTLITKSSFEGKLIVGFLYKLTITEGSH